MQEKEWWQSKTMWVNILAVVGAIISGLSGELATAGTLGVAGVANIVLRAITSQPIK